KQYGAVRAVDDLSFEAKPGVVTGFLGPNGAGKTTTMRMILGLDRPTAGHVTVNGRPYRGAFAPMREVGALIDPTALQTGRTARQHLRWLAEAGALSEARVAEVLDEVELGHAADRRISGFSLGMCQRLGLAAALLGDPGTLILDEPANGLDPAGIRWMRLFLRHLASEGRTVLLSSHLLSEVQQTVDDLVVIRRGELAFAGTPQELETETEVAVESADNAALAAALERAGGSVRGQHTERMRITGIDPEGIGEVALTAGIALKHLAQERAGLED